ENLGFAIIDEQHRFGVKQRSKLWHKNKLPPHILVMTATPIPRTLAMSLYGDLDISVIDELPPGRKPIQTLHKYDSNRLGIQGFMRTEIHKGRQVYVVFPLIEESEALDYKNLMEGYESLSRDFPMPKYQISVVHGQMSAADKEYEMQRFANGKTQIMIATTVIEVGVNVPNASVMIIESAERFGLSQLHQLRGRVGRGAEQSYCILITSYKLSKESKTRKTVLPGCDGEAPKGEASNGELPDEWLCEIGVGNHKLRTDAAVSFAKMNAAFKKDTGKDLAVTDSYRSLESQVSVAARKPGFAARPGTSN